MKTSENKVESIQLFMAGPGLLENALTGIDEGELDYIPKNNGWTIRQIIHHLADGDDLWKIGIKIALGNEHAEFNLHWYAEYPQTEWAKKWNYQKRSIESSLSLLKANRVHIADLIDSSEEGWNKSIQFRKPDGLIEIVTVGFVINMQSDHLIHHTKRIEAIREEYSSR